MIRNSKALGLALLATFALSAAAASNASASENIFDSSAAAADTILTGTSETAQVLARGVLNVTCSHAQFEGTVEGASTSTIEIQADYTTTSCTGPLNTQVHVDFTTGECYYHFTGTATRTAVPKLVCAKASGEVTLTDTSSDGSSLCTIHIPPQTFGGHVLFTNTEQTVEGKKVKAVTAASMITGISSTRTGSALCGPVSHTTATYNGNSTFTGDAVVLSPVDIEAT